MGGPEAAYDICLWGSGPLVLWAFGALGLWGSGPLGLWAFGALGHLGLKGSNFLYTSAISIDIAEVAAFLRPSWGP
jgi:hypothetical protein